MRTFVAVELDAEVRSRIEALRDRLRTVGANVKWVASHNTHLTLKFLGEIADDAGGRAAQIAASVASTVEPFEFRICGAGRFPPHSGRVRVLWVGVDDASGSLQHLHAELDRAFVELGVEREKKRFSGHITLGRLRRPQNVRELIAAVDALHDADVGAQSVEELVLFRSELSSSGPKYTPLARAPLGGPGP